MTSRSAALRADLITVPRSVLVAVVAAGLAGLAGLAVGRGYALPLIAILVFGAALLVGVINWRWSVYGLLLYLPFSGIPVIALYPDTAVPVLLKDLLFVIPAYAGFVAWFTMRRLPFSFEGAPVALFAMLALLVVVQAFNPALPNRLVGAIGAKVWLLYIPLYFLGYHLVQEKRDLFRLFGLMSIVAVVPAVIGIVEALLIYGGQADRVYPYYGEAAAAVTQDFTQLSFQGGGILRRIPSTFSFSAQYYIFLTSMVAVTFAWWRGALVGTRFSFLGCLVWLLMLAAVFLSGARGAFVFIPALVVLIVLLERRGAGISPSRALAPVAVFFGAVAIFGASGSEVIRHVIETGRMAFMSTFVDGFRQALAITWGGLGTGIDTGASRYAFPETQLFRAVGGTWYESWYVKVVLELGIAGLVLVGVLLGTVMIRVLREHVRLRDRELRVASAAIVALIAWALVYSLKAQYMDIDPMNVYFWLLAGVLAKMAALDRSDGTEDQTRESSRGVSSSPS